MITHRCTSEKALFEIIVANEALRNAGAQKVELLLPAAPEAILAEGAASVASTTLFTDILNTQGFDQIIILSPQTHQHVPTGPEIHSAYVRSLCPEYIKQIVAKSTYGEINIVCPDPSQLATIQGIVAYLEDYAPDHSYRIISCGPDRDPAKGRELGVYCKHLGGNPTLVIEDLVPSQRMKSLVRALRSKHCGPLAVFSSTARSQSQIDSLGSFFDLVFTTNAYVDFRPSKKLRTIPIQFE